jgi:hypothetical protein
MKTLGAALLALSPLALPTAAGPPAPQGLVALRVARAETVSHGSLRHAVILIEDGKIVTIGEDLPIERGIPVIDLDSSWVAIPGLVNSYSRAGLDGRAGSDSRPGQKASAELYPDERVDEELVKAGVTTLALYPPGNGIPGRAVAVKPKGKTPEEVLLADDVYLKIVLRSTSASKKMLRDGFVAADKYAEKEQKAREKWEKDSEKDKKKTDDKDKKEDAEKTEGPGPYVPPEMDDDARAFRQLREGSLRALVTLSQASDYLHFLHAIGKEEFQWDLRLQLTRESDFFHVIPEMASKPCRLVVDPALTLHPNTLRVRNLPAEMVSAGSKLVLIPRDDDPGRQKDWLRHVGELVAVGLSPEVALRAMTLEPAAMLGLDDRLGSLEAGKLANIVFLDGDPFEPRTRIVAVMMEGVFLVGEVTL